MTFSAGKTLARHGAVSRSMQERWHGHATHALSARQAGIGASEASAGCLGHALEGSYLLCPQ